MGLFSSIGKWYKGIWNGIKKIFKAVMKPVAKLLNSKLGKILMLAVSVFSMGSALLAGGKGFLAGEGFIGKFINGGKEFLNSLLGTKFDTAAPPGADAAGVIAEGAEAAAPGAVEAGDVLTGADAATIQVGAGGISEAAPVAPVTGPPAPLGPEGLAPGAMGPPAPTGGLPPAPEGNWLSQAMTAAKDFATSDTGATVIGSALQGYGRGKEVEAYLDEKSRVSRMFEDPNNPGMRLLSQHDFNVNAPTRSTAEPGRFAPSIPFRRPVAPAGG